MTAEKRVKRIARAIVGQPPVRKIEVPKKHRRVKHKKRMEDQDA
jgi:hypothetical protein